MPRKKKQAVLQNRRWKSTARRAQLREARKKIREKKNDSEHVLTDDGSHMLSESVDHGPTPSTLNSLCPFFIRQSVASCKKFKATHDKAEEKKKKKRQRKTIAAANEPEVSPPQPSTITDLNEVANMFAACACAECFRSTVRPWHEDIKSKGMAVCMKAVCSNYGAYYLRFCNNAR